jgi:hypothetical protein
MTTVSRRPLLWGTALLLTGAALYGCQDFLEDAAAPQGVLNEATLANRAGVEGTLIAAYRALDWNNGVGGAWGNTASNWVWGSVTSDDAYKGSESTDQPPIDDVEQYHWGTANAEGYLNEKWRGVYEGVTRANSALRLLAQVAAASPGEFSTAQAASIEGEALFLRAHFHFEAWRMWGNIPYYFEDDTDFRKANITSAEVVTNLLADLDAAIALLPVTPRAEGRAGQWTAKAYKGRVQAYAAQWPAALTTLREVRASGVFGLETSYDRVWTGFRPLENGPETILAYQASANDGEPNGNNANFGERLNFPHGGSTLEACCGFHQPSQNLVNFFQVDAAGLPLAISSPGTWNNPDANFTAANLTPVDPRLDWTVGRDGVPYKDWHAHAPGWIRLPAYGGFYSPKKNVHERASGASSNVGWVPVQLNSVNIHMFRYADMLLLLAEAEVEAGALANALTIVNEIRARAAVRVQGCGFRTDNNQALAYAGCAGDARIAVPITDPSIVWATYRVNPYPAFPDQNYARNAVRAERRLELAMEGQRFFDLRRWGIADQVLNDYMTEERTRRPQLVNAQTFAARHRYFPIPQIQIQLSRVDGTPRLTQNTGW